MCSRASNFTNHLNDLSINPSTKYAPSKGFDNTRIIQCGLSTAQPRDVRRVPVSQLNKPNDPQTQALIDACYANIKPGSTGQLLSKAPLKVGIRPTTIRKADRELFIANSQLEVPYKTPLAFSHVISGGFTGFLKQFHRFTDGVRGTTLIYKRRIANIKAMDIRFKISGPLPTPKAADIFYMPFRPKSLPGGDSSNSANKKGTLWLSACVAARDVWKTIHTRLMPNAAVYTCGGRDKATGWKDQGEWLQSRLVCQQDQVEFHAAKPYVRNIEQWLFNAIDIPIQIGKSLTGWKWTQLLYKLTWYPFGMEFDWSGYDSTVNAEYIIAAFAWCRSLFEESDEIDRAFCYFCHGYLEKFMVLQDGNTFKVTRGTPSGNAWTTVINSVVNCLLMEEMGSKYPGFTNRPFDYMVAGDDGVLFWKEVFNFNPDKLTGWIKRRTDMSIEVIKVGAPICTDPNESLTFNKKCFYWDGEYAVPTTQPKLLYKRLFPSSRPSGSLSSLIDTVEGQQSELLSHPECLHIMATVSSNLPANYDPVVGSLTASITQWNNEELYFRPKVATIYENDFYSKDKLHPLHNPHVFDAKVDWVFVKNWLRDNLHTGSPYPISRSERLQWFVHKMGVPDAVPHFFNKLLKTQIPLSQINIPATEIADVLRTWYKWYNQAPVSTTFIKGVTTIK